MAENEMSRRARMIQDFRGSQMRHGDFQRKRQELMQRPRPGAGGVPGGAPAPGAPEPRPAVQAPAARVPGPAPMPAVQAPAAVAPGPAVAGPVGAGPGMAPAVARPLPQAPMPPVVGPAPPGLRTPFLGLPGAPQAVGQNASLLPMPAQAALQGAPALNASMNSAIGRANPQGAAPAMDAPMGPALAGAAPVALTQEQVLADAIRAQNAKQAAAASGLNASMNVAQNAAIR